MTAIILAAGLGTRMQEKYPGIPKVMLSIGGKPILEQNINYLKKFGFDNIYINLHHLPEKIKNYFKNGKKFRVNISYFEEPVILGTAGALSSMKKDLKERFVVLYGDIFTKLDFTKFLNFHSRKKSQVTLLVHDSDHPLDSDLIALDDEQRVVKFYISPHPKPVTDTKLSSAAIYILEPETLKYIPKKIPADFMEDMFPDLLQKGFKMYGYKSDDYSKDMGTPERYEQVKKDIIALNLL